MYELWSKLFKTVFTQENLKKMVRMSGLLSKMLQSLFSDQHFWVVTKNTVSSRIMNYGRFSKKFETKL